MSGRTEKPNLHFGFIVLYRAMGQGMKRALVLGKDWAACRPSARVY